MKRVLIVAGIHGDEPSGSHAALSILLDPALKKKIARTGIALDVVPLANPSGMIRTTRKTIGGHDMNRYFSDKPQKNEPLECMALRNFLKNAHRTYDLLLSLHEDPEFKTFYLYDFGHGRFSQTIQSIFTLIKKHRIGLYTGLDDPDPVLNNFVIHGYVNMTHNDPAPMFEDYLVRHKKAKRVLTLEVPGKLPLVKKVELALELVKSVLGSL